MTEGKEANPTAGADLKIAVVESAPRGGLLHYAAQLADALADRGHDVELLTGRRNELEGRLRRARMRAVLPVAAPAPDEPPAGLRYLLRRLGIGMRLLGLGTSMAWNLARRSRYDVAVLVDDPSVALTAAQMLVLTLLPRRPLLVAICHEPRPRNRWSGAALYTRSPVLLTTLRLLYPRLDAVLVHGERSKMEFLRAWRARRVAVVPHGDERILGDDPPAAAPEERILFFGDWRRSKGLPELMAAFELLAARRPQVRLTIAGTPFPDAKPREVRSWASRQGGRVQVIDRYVALEELRPLFATARVVAAPYVAGSQSGVVHLAMTMGRAVVSSDVGELPTTVVDGETGRVVPAGDVDALADALEELVGDQERSALLGAAGRRRVTERFGWDTVGAVVERVLLELPRR
jgi:glycosyltransferase involved in cell wall biosynthesis